MDIELFNNHRHRWQVVDLWKEIFTYRDPRNKPDQIIDKKLSVNDSLFFVSVENNIVTGTVMAGYDGHRGWIYSLAIHPQKRRQGTGSKLLHYAEQKLRDLGCLKINLQILQRNEAVKNFYLANGYKVEERISMGKILN